MQDQKLYRPCVGLVILNCDKDVLVGKRLDAPPEAQHAWQMPQGGIDKGEAPEQAAVREMAEETGISAEKVTLINRTQDWLFYDLPSALAPKLWGGKYLGQRQLWFAFEFLGEDSDINIQTADPEFSEWGWRSPHDVLPHIVPFKRNIYTQVFKSFQLLT